MRTAPKVNCVCVVCKTPFTVLESRLKYGAGKFCSSKCCFESKKKRVTRVCAVCGKTFERAVSRIEGKRKGRCRLGRYCSAKCRSAGQEATPIEVRFWKYVAPGETHECWNWQGSKSSHGYGQVSCGRRYGSPLGAHRVSWQVHFGEIPNKLFVLHKCDNPACVNPNHLFLGTCTDNAIDASQKRRIPMGEKHHASKLTSEDVLECRRLFKEGVSMRKLAKKYGVLSKTISDAIKGVTWSHV